MRGGWTEDKPGMDPVLVGVGGEGRCRVRSETGGPHLRRGFNKTRKLLGRSSFISRQVSVLQTVMERPGGSFSHFLFYGFDKLGNIRLRGDEPAAVRRTSSLQCGKFILFLFFSGK